jgi:hypothetical protein
MGLEDFVPFFVRCPSIAQCSRAAGGGGGIKAVVRDSQQSRLFVSCACVLRVGCLPAECRQVLHFHLSSGAQKKRLDGSVVVVVVPFFLLLFFFLNPAHSGKIEFTGFPLLPARLPHYFSYLNSR